MTPAPSPIFFMALSIFGLSLAYAFWQLKTVNDALRREANRVEFRD